MRWHPWEYCVAFLLDLSKVNTKDLTLYLCEFVNCAGSLRFRHGLPRVH